MILSDVANRRPVLAVVISLLLVTFGVLSFDRLPLREYPDINPPVVTVQTDYRGANAAIVETKITQLIEDRVSGIEGIKWISSESIDGQSRLTIEFQINRDIDAAANDVREAVARVLRQLPDEADPPQVFKADTNADPIMWLNLASEHMDGLQLTDYAERYLVDRLSTVDGVALIRIGGAKRYAMRIWLDREALAARALTVDDVESALRRENVELPAGRVESVEREFNVRLARGYQSADDFARLVIRRGDDGHLVRLGEVARVAVGPENDRTELRGNGEDMVGLGIIQQSTANTLAVSQAVRAEVDLINPTLPEGTRIAMSYDTSVFIDGAIKEVFTTLFIAMMVVILVIYLFLGSMRAMLVPAVTVPVSLTAAFIALYALGFSVNLLTLLALVLAIGLVVDDAIVVLENIHRRIEAGEPPQLAAYRGARQVGFAVVATTLVLISVFVPLAFLEGNIGRLFTEFALAMAAAVAFSSIVALTLSPVMCARLIRKDTGKTGLNHVMALTFDRLSGFYGKALRGSLKVPVVTGVVMVVMLVAIIALVERIPDEYAPPEDRGAFFVLVDGPEGAGYEHMQSQMRQVEARLMPLIESGEAIRVLARTPRGFGGAEAVNNGFGIVVLAHWNDRERSAWEIMNALSAELAEIPDVRAISVMRQGLGGRRVGQPVQFVIGGPSYDELVEWRDLIIERASENPNLRNLDSDFKETRPQLMVTIDKDRAADLGVSFESIGRTLETVLGSRRVTTYIDRGEEYDVILEGVPDQRRTPDDIRNIYVRSATTGALIPLSNVVSFVEQADAATLSRYNRMRAITITAGLAPGYTLGEALEYLERIAGEELPAEARIDYKGESLEFKEAGGAILFIFVLALVVVFLVLAAQFESFVQPAVILTTVPLAVVGALVGLLLTGQTLNIYSQIGIVMLIGLAAKNGILIVEFTNQLRDTGREFGEALVEAAQIRLRPVLMTAFTTVMGTLPLILASGPGAESRFVIGTVVFSGVLFATLFTLFVVPVAYQTLARNTTSPGETGRRIDELDRQHGEAGV
ncbi:efflux RND transporter permease subunit [Ectothiorhodospira lacustris]|uniref:efflux RND transporter permease subunit n=1 Tax=Ectothiorhodospira lacustris TaxID=2899127 RepID=UPI001EE7D03E|nr:efflux RND transporter permease subunit [Ectothiorhodospira lacustris]MCG5501741.1 efflux RND transporter permease subunit [Ectothiorhodospira lacustris]MCG5510307.1 efflux RND transporter permease subunit [Ectothiorhodospira lacustris]MCG5522053.1 efflux RND transporter permease subunit [Ectothiorhodospira lacustris]